MENLKVIDHLRSTLEFKIHYARGKLMSLYSHRTKRALVNVLGSAIKLIAGNPDNEDLEIINHSLGTLEKQENVLSKTISKQIVINEHIQDKINNVTDILKKINRQINEHKNKSLIIKTDLEYINMMVNLDIIIQILGNIEEQIEFSKLNVLNKNLFSFEEKNYIFKRLNRQNLKLDYLDQIFQYCSGSVIVRRGEILILAKIPTLDDNEFDLVNIQPLNINNTRITSEVKLVAKHGNIIYKQSELCDVCEATTLLEDECIYNLLNHQTPKCVVKPVRQSIRVEEIKKGIILVDTNERVLISDSCNSSRLINTPTIIEAINCTIKVMNITYNNQISMENNEEYLLPVYGSKLIQLNYTEEKDEITHLKLDNLNRLQDVKLELHRSKRTSTIGGGILLMLISICSFTIYIINRRIKSKEATILEIHNHAETTTEHKGTIGKGEPGTLPNLVLFEKSSEDGRHSKRGDVTPRPTGLTAPGAKTSAKTQPRPVATDGGTKPSTQP